MTPGQRKSQGASPVVGQLESEISIMLPETVSRGASGESLARGFGMTLVGYEVESDPRRRRRLHWQRGTFDDFGNEKFGLLGFL